MEKKNVKARGVSRYGVPADKGALLFICSRSVVLNELNIMVFSLEYLQKLLAKVEHNKKLRKNKQIKSQQDHFNCCVEKHNKNKKNTI